MPLLSSVESGQKLSEITGEILAQDYMPTAVICADYNLGQQVYARYINRFGRFKGLPTVDIFSKSKPSYTVEDRICDNLSRQHGLEINPSNLVFSGLESEICPVIPHEINSMCPREEVVYLPFFATDASSSPRGNTPVRPGTYDRIIIDLKRGRSYENKQGNDLSPYDDWIKLHEELGRIASDHIAGQRSA